jgi:uncharacterized membrane protein (DUF4010 family)
VLAATRGTVTVEVGALAIVIAAAANGLAKSGLALSIGGRAYAKRIAAALLGGAAAAIAVAAVGISL